MAIWVIRVPKTKQLLISLVVFTDNFLPALDGLDCLFSSVRVTLILQIHCKGKVVGSWCNAV